MLLHEVLLRHCPGTLLALALATCARVLQNGDSGDENEISTALPDALVCNSCVSHRVIKRRADKEMFFSSQTTILPACLFSAIARRLAPGVETSSASAASTASAVSLECPLVADRLLSSVLSLLCHRAALLDALISLMRLLLPGLWPTFLDILCSCIAGSR